MGLLFSLELLPEPMANVRHVEVMLGLVRLPRPAFFGQAPRELGEAILQVDDLLGQGGLFALALVAKFVAVCHDRLSIH